MSLSCYMDHHVHSVIRQGLRRRAIDCLTAEEDGREHVADDLLLQCAAELRRIMFSQDDDLLAIAADWMRSPRPFVGLIYGHQFGLTVGQASSDLQLISQVLSAEEIRNQIFWIPL